MVPSDVAHHICDTLINGTALAMNALLLFVIVTCKSSHVNAYRSVLMVTCFSDLFLSAVAFVAQPVVLFSDGWIVFVSNGFFSGISRTFDYAVLVAFVSLINANMVCLSVQFVYRHLILCRHSGEARKKLREVFVLIVLPLAWCILHVAIIAWMVHADPSFQDVGLATLRNNHWPYDPTKPLNAFGSRVTNLDTVSHLITILITSVGGYGIIISSEYLILRRIRQIGMTINNQTRQMHNDINRALMALAAAPLLGMMVPVWFFMFCIATHVSPGPIAAFMTSSLTLITIANPMTTLYFVKPYRYAVLGAVGFRKAAVEPSKTIVTGVLSRATTGPPIERP